MIFYIDNSEFISKFSKKSNKCDVFCLGGFLISISDIKKIETIINEIKSKHGLSPDNIFKWNMKDKNIEKFYNNKKKYEEIIKTSVEWRKEIFKEIEKIESLKILISGARLLGSAKKEKVCNIVFTNLLQRFGLNLNDKNLSDNEYHILVIDWEQEMRDIYCKIFNKAYYNGLGLDGEIYKSGPLKLKNFAFPHLNFSVCYYNPLLQLSDLIIGCYASFFDYCFDGKKGNKEVLSLLFPYLKRKTISGPKGEIIRWGIIFRPEDDEDKIKIKLEEF